MNTEEDRQLRNDKRKRNLIPRVIRQQSSLCSMEEHSVFKLKLQILVESHVLYQYLETDNVDMLTISILPSMQKHLYQNLLDAVTVMNCLTQRRNLLNIVIAIDFLQLTTYLLNCAELRTVLLKWN